MQFKIFANHVSGFVNIVVEGYYIERFMNICASKSILLWNIKRDKSTILRASVGIQDFKRLKTVCKKTQCKMKICDKKGLPFILYRYKKRKLFLGLLCFLILLIIILSNFIWNIEVTGNETIPTEEILELAKNNGLSIGKFKNTISTKEVINQIRLQRDDVAWVGIEIEGTNVKIKIVEADKKPEIINEEEYCNIIADKAGMVTKINAQNGTPVVKVGDIVKPGDILIGGWMEGKYTGTRYVHSQGEIQAKVWYTNTKKVPLIETKKIETGEVENKYSVNINNFKINLYKRVSKFENYDTIEENKKLKLFSNLYLPLEVTKYINKEYQTVEEVHSVEEAKQLAIQRAKQELDEQVANKESVLNVQTNSSETADYVEVEVTYEVQETIGTKEKIIF